MLYIPLVVDYVLFLMLGLRHVQEKYQQLQQDRSNERWKISRCTITSIDFLGFFLIFSKIIGIIYKKLPYTFGQRFMKKN